MSLEATLPVLALDAHSLSDALGAGELDACVCELGEALLRRGRREDALVCARRALELDPVSERTLDFCAWLFSNCGCHAEAAALYERMLDRRPGWIEGHRHASGSWLAVAENERAIWHAIRASDLAPHHAEFALHAGSILLAAERTAEAAGYLGRAVAAGPDDDRAWRRLSDALLALDRPEEALGCALRAFDLRPEDRGNALHAAESLLRAGQIDDAADIADYAAATHRDDCAVLRLLSAAEMLRDCPQAALEAIERAIALAPERLEYHLHRGTVLHRWGDLDGAAAAFARAAALDWSRPEAKRSQLTIYVENERWTEALATGGELLRAFPEDEGCADAVLHLLDRRREILDGDTVLLRERPCPPARPAFSPPGFFGRMCIQGRVIQALIIRETRTRFGDSKLGYGWALLEPIMHIVMLSVVFSVMMHGKPPIGSHFFLFYYTGIIPYHLFVHTSGAMTHAITSNGSLLQLPLVTNVDVILARGLLELVTDVVVALILLLGFAALGLAAQPHDIGTPCLVLAVTAMLGWGVGFLNAVLQVFYKSWDKLWAQLTRILYFCSGIFYVPGMMPSWVRDVLAWNPVLQAIDWFRSGFFAGYEPHWLDRGYLACVALGFMLAGVAAERLFRRKLSEPL